MREEKIQWPATNAIQFDPYDKHKMELPRGVMVTKFSPAADNYAYCGFEFSAYNEDEIDRIYPGDWIVWGSNDKQIIIDDVFFKEHYEVI